MVPVGMVLVRWMIMICGIFRQKPNRLQESVEILCIQSLDILKLVRYQNAMVPASIQIETYPFPIIRLADLYLLYAEALNEAKKEEGTVPEDCYTYIDKVRARAGLKGVKIHGVYMRMMPINPILMKAFRLLCARKG